MSPSFAKVVLLSGSTPTSAPCVAPGDSTRCSEELVLLLQKGSLSVSLCQFHFYPSKLTLKRFSQGPVINGGISSPSEIHTRTPVVMSPAASPPTEPGAPRGSEQTWEMATSPSQTSRWP